MLKITKTVLPSPEQWQIIIEGMRNPLNSWDKSDSSFTGEFVAGEADLKLMGNLAQGGPVHAKYRRMIPVFVTLTAPLYWWKEFDTYKVGTVCNSCSTMHKIHSRDLTLDDFSCEHLGTLGLQVLQSVIILVNSHRAEYIASGDKAEWERMIQLLPTSYNQQRTILLNYEVLTNIYHSRKNHKLTEWHDFCRWIEGLPYSELITGRGADDAKTE